MVGSLVVACSSSDGADDEAGGSPASAECTQDRVGGEATLGMGTPVSALDPVKNLGTGINGGTEAIALYDTLVRYDPENDEYVPVVAKSLEPDADFTEWTLELREEVTFGNGDPLTAEVVKESFARHQDPANRSSVQREAMAVTEMEVVDPLTLVFHLDKTWARFPFLLAGLPGMITSPAVVEEQGEDFNTDPTGGGVGPYELDRYAPGEELVLKAKDDWWGGPVCIETLRFVSANGTQPTYDAFRNGDTQLAFMRGPEVIAQAKEDGVEGVSTLDNSGYVLLFNHESGPTADPLVRQAVAAALDPEVVNERALGGQGLTTTALIHEDSVLYNGDKGTQPDSARAADLVEQAKANGWDGHLDMPCQANEENNNICLAIKAQAEAAGMTVTIEPKQVTEYIEEVQINHNFEIASWGLPLSDADPSVRLSAAIGTGGGLNVGGYADPDMDAAIAALREAPDLAARQAALTDIQTVWNETLPAAVYGANENFVAIDDSLHGIEQSQYALLYFDKAYIDS